jgi:hypothetical protein
VIGLGIIQRSILIARIGLLFGSIVALSSLSYADEFPKAADANGSTPLGLAVESLNKNDVQLLLDRHADVNATDKKGRTPLAIIYVIDSDGWDYDQSNRCNEIEALLIAHKARVFTVIPSTDKIHPPFKITLRGRVYQQKTIDVAANETVTITQAILKAGGFGFCPDMHRIRVITQKPDGTNTMTLIDVKKIFDNLLPDVVLKSDTTIIVDVHLIN